MFDVIYDVQVGDDHYGMSPEQGAALVDAGLIRISALVNQFEPSPGADSDEILRRLDVIA